MWGVRRDIFLTLKTHHRIFHTKKHVAFFCEVSFLLKVFFVKEKVFFELGGSALLARPSGVHFLKRFLRRWSVELIKWFCTQKARPGNQTSQKKAICFSCEK